MTNATHTAKSTHCAMITDMKARTVIFINALGYTCALADCSGAELKGMRAKVIKKESRSRWGQAARKAGFSVTI